MIHILTADVYNRIAAGEVVDRPYSVVKELVENAIDAGATEITVEIEAGGKKRVRVTDNGCGIEKSDLKSAYLPHATSKLATAEDLAAIVTLGFRGEAIASIASVSRMNIVAKTKDGEAWSLSCEGGTLGEISPAGGANGVCVTVDDLFFNTPARLKFLKSDSQEEGDVAGMVARFILSRPEISFTYLVNGKVRYRSFGDGLKSALAVVYGPGVLGRCYELNADKHGLRLHGFIGDRNFSKPNRTYQNLFVNGRYVVNQTVSSAVANAYRNYLMKRQYPFFVLFLDLPPEIVDVNVHPNKTDVRFADNRIVYGCVYSVVSAVLDGNSRALEYLADVPAAENAEQAASFGGAEQAASFEGMGQAASFAGTEQAASFGGTGQAASFEGTEQADSFGGAGQAASFGGAAAPVAAPQRNDRNISAPPISTFSPSFSPLQDSQSAGAKRGSPVDSAMSYAEAKKELAFDVSLTGGSPSGRYTPVPQPNVLEVRSAEESDFFEENRRRLLENERRAKQEKIDPSTLEYKGELFRTYLVYERGDEAYLIDQHAAHERLLFDRLCEKAERRSAPSQPMLLPYLLNVNPQEGAFLSKNLDILRSFGFEIEEFGAGSFKVSAVPVDLFGMDLDAFFAETLSSMEQLRAIKLTDILKDRLATMACKAAVKGGEPLSETEVRALLTEMEGDMGVKCPHGRPACVRIRKSELEKLFKRIV